MTLRRACMHRSQESGASSSFRRKAHGLEHHTDYSEPVEISLEYRLAALEADLARVQQSLGQTRDKIHKAIFEEIRTRGGLDPVEFAFRTGQPLSLIEDVVKEF